MATIHERVANARARLIAAGVPRDEADRDARLLARWALGWDASRFWTSAGEGEPTGFSGEYDQLIERRAAREPVAYITGTQEFWGLDFDVSPAVLIPRPETELVVEAALELCPTRDLSLDIADVATGSGCLAVTLAKELPSARVTATDVSDRALEVARRNAARHGVSARIDFRSADLLSGVNGAFNLIVANPPYVPERDRATLQPEVRDHEPPVALFAGEAGLSVITRLLDQAVSRLEPGGVLIFEFGFGQADAVRSMVASTSGLTGPDIRQDLQGIARVAMAQRKSTVNR